MIEIKFDALISVGGLFVGCNEGFGYDFRFKDLSEFFMELILT